MCLWSGGEADREEEEEERWKGKQVEEAYKAINRQCISSYCHMCCSQVETAEVIAVKKYGWLANCNQATRVERPKQNGANGATYFDLIGVCAVRRELEK